MSLQALQKDFAQAILTGDSSGVREKLELPDDIKGIRFSTYPNGYFSSYTKVLAADHKTVAKIMGEENFQMMAAVYVKDNPAHSGDLNEYGHKFPDFIEQMDSVHDFMADIARLDRLKIICDNSVNSEPMDPASMANLPPEDLPNLKLPLLQNAHFLSSQYNIRPFFEREGIEDIGIEEIREKTSHAIVFRPYYEVKVLWLEGDVYEFFQALKDGSTIEDAYTAAAGLNEQFDLQKTLETGILNDLFGKG